MPPEDDRLQRSVLVHLLEHHGQQIRFEASHWATEIGILRRFAAEDPILVKAAIRTLESARLIYRRIQYVVGFSEPKSVFALTTSGYYHAIECRRMDGGPGATDPTELPSSTDTGDEPLTRGAPEPSA